MDWWTKFLLQTAAPAFYLSPIGLPADRPCTLRPDRQAGAPGHLRKTTCPVLTSLARWTRSAVAVILPALLPLLLPPASAPAWADPIAAAAKAKELGLAQTRDWQLLLHDFPQSAFGVVGRGYHSMLDDPNYFLAKDGEDDAEAELEATIRAMYLPQADALPAPPATEIIPQAEPVREQPGDEHAQCRFPARYTWLKSRLGSDLFNPAVRPCPSFDEWFKNLQPRKIILVFPAAYLNSPASMFGHTLLRIESTESGTAETILGHGASFAAFTGDDGGIPFAYKGLFGGYVGAYSVQPYYKEIRRYSDLEHRDVWEYELAFSPDQVDRIVRHLWELERNYFNYYFFDENCALHLLGLLDYGNPGLHLSERLPFWVIPAEAVRAIVDARKEDGAALVTAIHFRPSRSTKIHALQAEMSAAEQDNAKLIAEGGEPPGFEGFSPERRAKVLELAIVYIEYLNNTRKVPVEESKSLEHKLLIERSKLPTIAPPKIDLPATRPEQGHRPGRLSIGAGRRGDKATAQLRIRPADHENIDPQPGYVDGAQVSFFDLTLEQSEQAGLLLESFVPLKILSLSPLEKFIRPWSWNVETGLRRLHGEETDPISGYLAAGLGASFRPMPALLLYALVQPQFELQRDYRDDYRIAAGPESGAFFDLSDSVRLGLSAGANWGLGGETEGRFRLGAEVRWAFAPGGHPLASVRSAATRSHELDSDTLDWKLLLDLYF